MLVVMPPPAHLRALHLCACKFEVASVTMVTTMLHARPVPRLLHPRRLVLLLC